MFEVDEFKTETYQGHLEYSKTNQRETLRSLKWRIFLFIRLTTWAANSKQKTLTSFWHLSLFFFFVRVSLSLVCFFESVKINLNLMLRSVVHYTFQQHLRIFQVSIFLLFSRLNTVAFQNLLFTNISLFIWNFSSTTLSLSYFVWGRDRFGDQRLNSHFTVF
jgi:hypothetical protein